MSRPFLLSFAILSMACGGKAPPAPDAPPAAAPASGGEGAAAGPASGPASGAAPSAEPAKASMPTDCASKDGDICLPDAAFVKRLCNGSFPDAALRFFQGNAPWTRAYMTRDVDGWNAEGGAAARARLATAEEVVLLRRRSPPPGGMQVGSGAGFLVLRVDGSCYTFDDLEVTRKKPSSPRSGPVVFRYLDEGTQSALLKNARIEAAYQRRRKECKGATSGSVTKACESADVDLARAVPEELRKGGLELPAPARIP